MTLYLLKRTGVDFLAFSRLSLTSLDFFILLMSKMMDDTIKITVSGLINKDEKEQL
jgi:hypothetical protein